MTILKVAVVGRYPLRRDRVVGGVEAAILYLTEELRQRPGLDLHVVTLRPEIRQQHTISEDGLTVHYLPASRRWGHVTHHVLERHRLVRQLHQIKPDLVHAHIAGEYVEAAHQSGYPYVVTLHGIRHRECRLWKRGIDTGIRAFLIGRWERECIRKAKYIISISPYVAQEFRHLIRGKVYEIDNPVPQAFFDVQGPGQEGRLLFVGIACVRKGFLELLQALTLVKEAHLHVAGPLDHDRNFLYKMDELLRKDDLQERVKFLGSLDESSLIEEYRNSSIFVLPSIQETAPVALLEAMAAGRPSVVTRVGGHPYLIEHGRTGLLVEPKDIEGLAQALEQLLVDREAQREMGVNARAEALERFYASRLAEKTIAVYQEVLSSA